MNDAAKAVLFILAVLFMLDSYLGSTESTIHYDSSYSYDYSYQSE